MSCTTNQGRWIKSSPALVICGVMLALSFEHDSLDKQYSLAVARTHKVQLFLVCPLPCLQDCLDWSKNSLTGNGLEKAFPLKIALDQVIEVSTVTSAATPVFWNRNVPKVHMLFLPYVHYVAVRTAVKSASSMGPGAGWFMIPLVYIVWIVVSQEKWYLFVYCWLKKR